MMSNICLNITLTMSELTNIPLTTSTTITYEYLSSYGNIFKTLVSICTNPTWNIYTYKVYFDKNLNVFDSILNKFANILNIKNISMKVISLWLFEDRDI